MQDLTELKIFLTSTMKMRDNYQPTIIKHLLLNKGIGSKKELATFRNLHLGFIFQLHHLMPQLTLWENVLLPLLPQANKITARLNSQMLCIPSEMPFLLYL